MRLIILILFSVFFLSFTGKRGKSDASKVHLKGKVKFIVQTTFGAKNKSGKIVKLEGRSEKSTYSYNDKGNVVEFCPYFNDTIIQWKEVSIYDNKDNLILVNHYDPDGKLGLIRKYYKKSLMQIKKIETSLDTSKLGSYFIYENDSFPNDTAHYGAYFINQYDSLDNLIERDSYWGNRLDNKWTYNYDKNGNLIVLLYSDFTNKRIRIVSYYDKDGNLIGDSSAGTRTINDYKTKYQYEDFDRNGNWLKEIIIHSDSAIEILERKIEYN